MNLACSSKNNPYKHRIPLLWGGIRLTVPAYVVACMGGGAVRAFFCAGKEVSRHRLGLECSLLLRVLVAFPGNCPHFTFSAVGDQRDTRLP